MVSNGFVVPVSDDERVATIKDIDELNRIKLIDSFDCSHAHIITNWNNESVNNPLNSFHQV